MLRVAEERELAIGSMISAVRSFVDGGVAGGAAERMAEGFSAVSGFCSGLFILKDDSRSKGGSASK